MKNMHSATCNLTTRIISQNLPTTVDSGTSVF